jgi:hypothetical protein
MNREKVSAFASAQSTNKATDNIKYLETSNIIIIIATNYFL